MTDPVPIHDLAGVQDDPRVEEVLAVLYTDQPVREDLRPGDSRRHWQFWARKSEGSSSRLWLVMDQPIVETIPKTIEQRAVAALTQAFIPDQASAAEASARQISFTEVELVVVITWLDGVETSLNLLVVGGSGA